MAQRKDRRKDPNKQGIFEEEKQLKASGKELLKEAKKQESEKLKNGYHFVSLDSRTKVLRKS